MATEYRVLFTCTFETLAERDKVSTWLKTQFSNAKTAGNISPKKADIMTDDYYVQEVPTVKETL